jgi:hypothetical protein
MLYGKKKRTTSVWTLGREKKTRLWRLQNKELDKTSIV